MHAQDLYSLCLRLLGNPTRAEDATHDVFLRSWRSFGQFRRATPGAGNPASPRVAVLAAL